MKNKLLHTFRGFASRNYRLYFFGQGISLIGSWIQRTAMSWFIYSLTNSVFWLGFINFISQIPSLFITPISGVIADRYPRYKIIKITQTLCMLQALTLSILVLRGNVQLWQVIVLSMTLGVIEAFEAPVRHSFVIDMVEKQEDIGNAIALNSTMFNGARLIGPSIAGFMVAKFGEGYCFLINGMSYIAVLISLFNMRITKLSIVKKKEAFFNNFKEGLHYVIHFKPIRYFLSNTIVFTLFGFSYVVLLPFFAKTILKGDARTLGFIMSGIGTGALIGALHLASRKSIKGLGTLINYAGHLAALGVISLSFVKTIWIAIPIVIIVGFGMMLQMAGTNTIIQTIVDNDKRGRVMGLYSMSMLSFMPIGSLLSGTMSKLIGFHYTVLISGSICFIGSFLLHFKLPLIKQVIQEKLKY